MEEWKRKRRWRQFSSCRFLVSCFSLSSYLLLLAESSVHITPQNSLTAQSGAGGVGGSISALQQSMSRLLQVFSGNESALESNHFKLMERDGDSLLLGAKNVVYNLSLSSMREQRRLEWPSSEDDVRLCRVKGKSSEQCQNYIRVLKLQSPDTLFVCGTNAYKPRCRTYLITSDTYELVSESPGEGACPYQENQNVTSVFAEGQLYSATATQFSGIDGLIHRAPLRTEQFNPKQLNSPNFVSSFRYGNHVYFLFREVAIEHINCGKTIYSRIARVCINDSGGPSRASRERWTSFVKARLNCSIPGEFPFYFDEIQASSGVISASASAPSSSGAVPPTSTGAAASASAAATNPASDLLYAVFTTPTNSIGGSAVCAYRMSDVLAAFEGPFKAQADSNSNWLPVPESRVPQPRPGTCVNDSKQLPDEKINFIKDNPLMDTAIEPIWAQPLIMMASINFRFTQIVVDPQVETRWAPGASSMRTDVIFVATDDGRLFKLINTHHLFPPTTTHFRSSSSAQQSTVNGLPVAAPYYLNSAGSGNRAGGSSPLALAQMLTANSNQPNREPLPDVSASTLVIEELHLFDARTPIINLMLYYPSPAAYYAAAISYQSNSNNNNNGPLTSLRPKLLVISAKQLKAVPLSRCERALTCTDCLALFDPYCAWDSGQQLCLEFGRSISNNWAPGFPTTATPGSGPLRGSHAHLQGSTGWFPPNGLANNHTFAWWLQCPLEPGSQQPSQQQVGTPFRSLFSSHLQVPSRFDYASGHHLSSHSSGLFSFSPVSSTHYRGSPAAQMQPVSECLTFCGAQYPMQQQQRIQSLPDGGQQSIMNCADYVQHHYFGSLSGNPNSNQSSTIYTSENLYFAVIICAVSGLILGLVFGFAIGRNAKKHDSSICSSTFDETNLYMASTGSHHPANHLFAPQQQRLNHPLLQQQLAAQTNGLMTGPNPLRPAPATHLFDASQCLLQDTSSTTTTTTTNTNTTNQNNNYGNQQQMLLQLANSTSAQQATLSSNLNTRTGALPPLPNQQHSPLISTSNQTSNHHHSSSQLTPNSMTSNHLHQHHHHLHTQNMSTGSTANSSTNTSNTSATVPANEHQLYLNQQQQQQLLHQLQANNQRSFNNGSSNNNNATNKAVVSGGKNSQNSTSSSSSFLLQQQSQQQNNKIYL